MSKRTTRTDFESLEISADPKSAIQNQKSGPVEQQVLALPSTDPSTGPVECLGMSFPNDDERRKYFLKKLPEKLKDPDFRKIKGFPIGEDEDILALSDPPYYTACPNPWLTDFVMFYGTAYNPKKHYHREPFAADVNEGKNHPIYNAHSYHTKVPHRAILRYILHYTEPGDLVFDGFAGTGMTGVAARLCGNRSEVQALGYRVHEDGAVLNEQGQNFSKVGARHIIINDLSTIATFVANGYMMPVDAPTFQREVRRVLAEIETEPGWMFETFHLFSATYSSALNAALKLFTECRRRSTATSPLISRNCAICRLIIFCSAPRPGTAGTCPIRRRTQTLRSCVRSAFWRSSGLICRRVMNQHPEARHLERLTCPAWNHPNRSGEG